MAYGKKGWAQYQKEDKKRREENPTFREQSKASRVQYSLKGYEGKRSAEKGTDTYQWEKDMLKDQYKGKSYNDKYKAMTDSLGLSEVEAQEYRKWLDFQEDQKQSYKLNKDGGVDQRKTVHPGQGATTLDQYYDTLIKTTNDNYNKLQAEKQQRAEEAAKPKKPTKTDKVIDFLTGKDIDNDGTSDGIMTPFELLDRPGDAVRSAIKTKKEGGSFTQGLKEGFSGKQNTEGTELNRSLGFNPDNGGLDRLYSMLLGKGAISKLPLGGLIEPFLGNKARTKVGEEILGMGTESVLDPTQLIGAGGLVQGIKTAGDARSLVNKVDDAGNVISTKFDPDIFRQVLDETMLPPESRLPLAPKAEIPPTSTYNADEAERILSELVGNRTQEPKVNATQEPLATLDDLLFGQNTANVPKARGLEQNADVSRYGKEYVSELGDKALAVKPKPEEGWNNRLLATQRQMDEFANNERTNAEQQLADIWERRQLAEDDFVQQEMQPFNDMLLRSGQVDAEWGNSIKQAKELTKRIQEQYGKIVVPESNRADWWNQVPPRFRANKNERTGIDLYRFAEDEGFANVDDAIRFLQDIDETVKMRMKDLLPPDNMKVSPNQLSQLEDAARQKFGETDTARGLDTYFDDLLKVQSDRNPDSLYNLVRGENDPETFDELLRLAQNEVEEPLTAKLANDKQINELIGSLFGTKPKPEPVKPEVNPTVQLGSDYAPTQTRSDIDSILSSVDGTPVKPKPTSKVEDSYAVLQTLNEQVKNNLPEGATFEDVFSELKRVGAENGIDVEGVMKNMQDEVKLTPEQETAIDTLTKDLPPEQKKDFRMRLSLTMFSSGGGNNPMVNVSKVPETQGPLDMKNPLTVIEDNPIKRVGNKLVKNPVEKVYNRFIQSYVNRNHSLKVAEQRVIEDQLVKAKETGDIHAEAILKRQLKEVKRSGSKLEWAAQNESAASNAALSFTEHHYKEVRSALGKKATDKDVADAVQWLMAKNLQWNKDAGRITDKYDLPYGWDWNRINQVAGAGDVRPEYQAFADKFRGMMQERRDLMLQYGMLTDEAYKDLSENPFYVPLKREKSFGKDNIDLSVTQGKNTNSRNVDNYILHDLGEGDLKSFYKNPLDSVIEDNFTMFRYLAENDTGQQLKRLADIDDGHLYVKEVSKEAASKDMNNVYAFYENGEKKYLRVQGDLMKIIKDNDNAMDMTPLRAVTSIFARLKTSSIEYQTAAVPRDLLTNYVTSQAGPIEFFTEAFKAVKARNKDASEVGAIFQRAYDDNYGDIDPKKVSKVFERQHKNVKLFDTKNREDWKALGQKIGKVLNAPFKPAQAIGQYTDELPRQVEVQMVAKKYQKPIADLEQRIASLDAEIQASQKGGAFSPSTLGIDNKIMQLDNLKNTLRQTKLDMRREQIYRGRDVINYARSGGGKTAKFIKNFVIFANTTIQSKDKLVRSFMERPLQTTIKAAIAVGPIVTAEKMLFDRMSGDDKEIYDNLPDYVRQANYVFVSDGKVILLPKVHELALITNPIEDAMRGYSLESSKRNVVKELAPFQLGNALQAIVPEETGQRSIMNAQAPSTVITPTFDILANQKLGFNQKPISYDAQYNRDDPKANAWTMEFLKDLVGDTPTADRTDYTVRQYGGDLGKYGLYLGDYLAETDNQDKLDELLRNVNPLQDRLQGLDPIMKYLLFKEPIQEDEKKK